MSFVVDVLISLMFGRVATDGASGAVNLSAAGAPKRSVARCFAAAGTVNGAGVEFEVEGAHVGWCGVPS